MAGIRVESKWWFAVLLGAHVVSATNETLVAGDPPGRDLFGRLNGADTAVLTPTTQQLYAVELAGLSSDGTELILRTRNALALGDDDFGKDDLYRTTVFVPEPCAPALLALRVVRGRRSP